MKELKEARYMNLKAEMLSVLLCKRSEATVIMYQDLLELTGPGAEAELILWLGLVFIFSWESFCFSSDNKAWFSWFSS